MIWLLMFLFVWAAVSCWKLTEHVMMHKRDRVRWNRRFEGLISFSDAQMRLLIVFWPFAILGFVCFYLGVLISAGIINLWNKWRLRNAVRPDMEHLGDGMYIVRTQGGFKQAVTQFLGDVESNMEIESFPSSYPALISFYRGYQGYAFLGSTSVHLNDLKKVLKRQGEI